MKENYSNEIGERAPDLSHDESGACCTRLGSTLSDDDHQFLTKTCATFGPTLVRRKSGRAELNHATMSRILARRHKITYDADMRVFFHQETNLQVTTSAVTESVTTTLQQIAAQHSQTFPLRELHPARIKLLVETMKVTATLVRPDRHSGLRQFVAEQLCSMPGHALTVDEIYDAYCVYARESKILVYPRPSFQREIHPALLAAFGKAR
jgi:hypothetical protein